VKHIVFVRARASAGSLHHWLLARYAPGSLAAAAAVSVNVVSPSDDGAPWDAVIELWGGHATASPGSLRTDLEPHAAALAIYRVTELVGKDTGPHRGWPTAGVKLVVPWIGRSDVTPAEQRRHWDEHVPLANRIHVGVTRYVRNWVDWPAPGTDAAQPPYQGIATQHFPSERDMIERSFDRPESVQVIAADVADFLAGHIVLRTQEFHWSQGNTAASSGAASASAIGPLSDA
jgi:hypothetical protein